MNHKVKHKNSVNTKMYWFCVSLVITMQTQMGWAHNESTNSRTTSRLYYRHYSKGRAANDVHRHCADISTNGIDISIQVQFSYNFSRMFRRHYVRRPTANTLNDTVPISLYLVVIGSFDCVRGAFHIGSSGFSQRLAVYKTQTKLPDSGTVWLYLAKFCGEKSDISKSVRSVRSRTGTIKLFKKCAT